MEIQRAGSVASIQSRESSALSLQTTPRVSLHQTDSFEGGRATNSRAESTGFSFGNFIQDLLAKLTGSKTKENPGINTTGAGDNLLTAPPSGGDSPAGGVKDMIKQVIGKLVNALIDKAMSFLGNLF